MAAGHRSPTSHSKNTDRNLEEAQNTGYLDLSSRKLVELPKVIDGYDLTDTVEAGGFLFFSQLQKFWLFHLRLIFKMQYRSFYCNCAFLTSNLHLSLLTISIWILIETRNLRMTLQIILSLTLQLTSHWFSTIKIPSIVVT